MFCGRRRYFGPDPDLLGLLFVAFRISWTNSRAVLGRALAVPEFGRAISRPARCAGRCRFRPLAVYWREVTAGPDADTDGSPLRWFPVTGREDFCRAVSRCSVCRAVWLNAFRSRLGELDGLLGSRRRECRVDLGLTTLGSLDNPFMNSLKSITPSPLVSRRR